MPNSSVTVDHVHLISPDPQATANWYVDKLGGEIVKSSISHGAPQVYVSLGGPMVLIRGQRAAELPAEKPGLEWGIDHFGLRVPGDFDGYCAGLRAKGVVFSLDPTDTNPTTRIAYIRAPDGVSIELLDRRDWPWRPRSE